MGEDKSAGPGNLVALVATYELGPDLRQDDGLGRGRARRSILLNLHPTTQRHPGDDQDPVRKAGRSVFLVLLARTKPKNMGPDLRQGDGVWGASIQRQPVVNGFKQIMPIGIGGFDQIDLPGAFPHFEAFFALYGEAEIFVKLTPNQPVNAVASGEF
jgi:hypothetical protein